MLNTFCALLQVLYIYFLLTLSNIQMPVSDLLHLTSHWQQQWQKMMTAQAWMRMEDVLIIRLWYPLPQIMSMCSALCHL